MVIQTEPIVWPGRPYPLGANWDGEGVNFALFSEHAEAVELCLFDQAGRRELHRVRIKDQTDQVWHCYLPEARPGLLYGYRVHGPYDPNKGHRFNPHKLLLDAYAKICRGDRVTDERLNPVANELRLSGVVSVKDGNLQQRNRIYAQIFDLKWVQKNLPDAEARRQRAAYYRGVRRVVGVAAIVLMIMGGLAFNAWRSAKSAQAASKRATAAAESETKAHEKLLEEAERTKSTLNHFVETQSKVEGLLGALTPLVGEKSGKLILERAEDVVGSVATEAADDPRIVLGVAGLRRVCGQLYLRLGIIDMAFKQAEEAARLVLRRVSRAAP